MLVIKKVSKEDASTAFSAGFATTGVLPTNGSKAPIAGSSVYKNLVPKPAVAPTKVRIVCIMSYFREILVCFLSAGIVFLFVATRWQRFTGFLIRIVSLLSEHPVEVRRQRDQQVWSSHARPRFSLHQPRICSQTQHPSQRTTAQHPKRGERRWV